MNEVDSETFLGQLKHIIELNQLRAQLIEMDCLHAIIVLVVIIGQISIV